MRFWIFRLAAVLCLTTLVVVQAHATDPAAVYTSNDPFLIWLMTTPYAAVVPYLGVAVGICSLIVSVVPMPAPGSHWTVVWRLINFVAFNFGRAANPNQPTLSAWLLRLLQPLVDAQVTAQLAAQGTGKDAPATPLPAPGAQAAPAPAPAPGAAS